LNNINQFTLTPRYAYSFVHTSDIDLWLFYMCSHPERPDRISRIYDKHVEWGLI